MFACFRESQSTAATRQMVVPSQLQSSFIYLTTAAYGTLLPEKAMSVQSLAQASAQELLSLATAADDRRRQRPIDIEWA